MNHHLVIQLARMGDVVQSLPLLERLRTDYSKDKITLVVDASLVALFEQVSGIDQIYGVPMEEAWNRSKESSLSEGEADRVLRVMLNLTIEATTDSPSFRPSPTPPGQMKATW